MSSAVHVLLVIIIVKSTICLASFSSELVPSQVPEEEGNKNFPIVISTWPFVEAVRAAWQVVDGGGSPLDAVVAGCSACESLRCDGSVGYGGSPDENGETTLDAMIMDGTTMDVGAVGSLRYVRDAIRAARLVMDHTEHTLLVGDQASEFAISMGLSGPANLSTDDSMDIWSTWRATKCQPNFWRSVVPEATSSCGPYEIQSQQDRQFPRIQDYAEWRPVRRSSQKGFGYKNHDTISMAVISRIGRIAVGTSTNGATHKIPGRVGDGPIVGASAYADDDVGACGATGDGDIMMRFLPCYQVVESMRRGQSPEEAATDAIARMKTKFPSFVGAVFAVDRHGNHSGACYGWVFQYTVRSSGMDGPEIFTIRPQDESLKRPYPGRRTPS
ncbi:hypothetical protein R1flu_021484 [Riccia fluitans]|uniref:beta-aspartyl-peptidase n=1 Tax=Riccia fluitans TaxID=41844 RepID=A0ABD1ZPI1_9MARC